MIRPACPDDITAITAIYAEAVTTSTATFEIEPPDATVMAQRLAQVAAAGLPFLVAVSPNNISQNKVLGYAYAAPFRERAGFRFTAENSIYIDAEERGRGLGTALLDAVLAQTTERGYRRMIAVIGDGANGASIRLHAKAGFVPAGTLPACGWKFGRWLDVVLMQRPLGAGCKTPAPETA